MICNDKLKILSFSCPFQYTCEKLAKGKKNKAFFSSTQNTSSFSVHDYYISI